MEQVEGWELPPIGVWADANIRNRFIGEKIQQLADDMGWDGPVLSADNEDYDLATLEAEKYLEELAPDGYIIGRIGEGSFGMYRDNGYLE
tara:strand:+ start:103 stop:372 length:270 start_codon:yes stop_codon:yes gene_type:complete